MKFEAKIIVDVPDGTALVLLNPVQQLTGRIVKEGATAEGIPDTREQIPCSIIPIAFAAPGYEIGRLVTEIKKDDGRMK